MKTFDELGLWPWDLARGAFSIRSDLKPPDRRVFWVSSVRSVLGVVFTAMITGRFDLKSNLDSILEGVLRGLALGAVVSMLAAVATMVLAHGHLSLISTGFRAYLITWTLAIATLVVPVLVFFSAANLLESDNQKPFGQVDRSLGHLTLGLLSIVAALAVIPWLPYAVTSIFLLNRSVFSVAEIHPMLGPTSAWVTAVASACWQGIDGESVQPYWWWTVGGGVASIGAVAYYEFYLLEREGWRLGQPWIRPS